MRTVYPEYLTDLTILDCPGSPVNIRFDRPECVSSLYYVYAGYAIVSDEQALAPSRRTTICPSPCSPATT